MRNIQNKIEDLSVKNYLRADPHTQIYELHGQKLVTDEMFWGTESEQSIYLHYKKVKGRCIKVSEGMSYSTRTLDAEECDEWLDNNLYKFRSNMLYVIQGYAGCGKTTLMHHIMKYNEDRCDIRYVDIGAKWRLEREQSVLFDETLCKFLDELQFVLKQNNWNLIMRKFIELGRNSLVDKLDTSIRPFVSKIKEIVEYKKNNCLTDDIIDEIITDVGAALTERFSVGISENQNHGNVGLIVSLLVLLICASANTTNNYNRNYMLIYDNLDVITNPAISAEMILSLWSVIINLKNYTKNTNEKLPNFVFCITVRKMLYTHITTYLPELEHNLSFDNSCTITCDISELYPSEEILEHRIKYWLSNDSITESVRNRLNSLDRIKIIMGKASDNEQDEEAYYLPKQSIDLDGLFNHNFRACANMLSEFLDDVKCSKFIIPVFESNDYSYAQKTSALIFAISFIYRKLEIWSKLGFRCKGCNSSVYPTTLFRVILTQLYVSKIRSTISDSSFAYSGEMRMNDFVSISEIIDTLSRVSFIPILDNYSQEEIDDEYNNVSMEEKRKNICSMLAKMCTTGRTMVEPLSRGYVDDNELWRRPIYFIGGIKTLHTAASYNELYQQFQNDNTNNIKFSITDEGCVIVSDFVASFEFYSARYCESNLAKPLYLADNEYELTGIINPVLNAVRLCCKRQITFMNNYISSYVEGDISNAEKNRYLKEMFHPRTNPRFRDDEEKNLVPESFRPQLHIVRVIYNHILYLNEIKRFFSLDKNRIALCQKLTNYIGEYLDLYKKYFYDVLKSTIGSYNNSVYDDLMRLFQHQQKLYKENKLHNIDINRKNKDLLKRLSSKRIT